MGEIKGRSEKKERHAPPQFYSPSSMGDMPAHAPPSEEIEAQFPLEGRQRRERPPIRPPVGREQAHAPPSEEIEAQFPLEGRQRRERPPVRPPVGREQAHAPPSEEIEAQFPLEGRQRRESVHLFVHLWEENKHMLLHQKRLKHSFL